MVNLQKQSLSYIPKVHILLKSEFDYFMQFRV